MDDPIVHQNSMKNKKNLLIRLGLYLCFINNTIYAVKNGFNFLYYVCAITTALVLITGIMEDFRHGHE